MAQSPTLAGVVTPRRHMTYEEFLLDDSEEHAEWVDGEVVPMVSVSVLHQQVTLFLIRVVGGFVEFHALGQVFFDPFNMKTAPHLNGRAPDLMYVANAHADRIRGNYLEGPADLAVEVVSPGGGTRDRGEKFYEYEEGGVPEYWLIDPQRKVAEFYQLDSNGRYQPALVVDGVYRSAVLDGLWLQVSWLWDRPPVRDVEEALGLR